MLDTFLNLTTAGFYVLASVVLLYIQREHYSHTRFNLHRLIYIAGAGVCAVFALRFIARSPPFFYDPTLPTISVANVERWIGLFMAGLSLELLNLRSHIARLPAHMRGSPHKSIKQAQPSTAQSAKDTTHEAAQKQN